MKRCYRSLSFPDIICGVGSSVPTRSLYHSASPRTNTASDVIACPADLWTDVNRDLRAPTLHEQVYVQQNGVALNLLRHNPVPAESAEERRLEEGWRYRFQSGVR